MKDRMSEKFCWDLRQEMKLLPYCNSQSSSKLLLLNLLYKKKKKQHHLKSKILLLLNHNRTCSLPTNFSSNTNPNEFSPHNALSSAKKSSSSKCSKKQPSAISSARRNPLGIPSN